MLSLTRKTDYALVALARLAQEQQGGDEEVARLSARTIAEEFELPQQLLMSILKELHRAGIVDSTRGAQGGYVLAKPANKISVAEIVEAIEGAARLAPCCADEEPEGMCTMCSITERCPITGAIRELNGQIADYLRTVTLDTLMQSTKGRKLPAVGKTARAKLAVLNTK